MSSSGELDLPLSFEPKFWPIGGSHDLDRLPQDVREVILVLEIQRATIADGDIRTLLDAAFAVFLTSQMCSPPLEDETYQMIAAQIVMLAALTGWMLYYGNRPNTPSTAPRATATLIAEVNQILLSSNHIIKIRLRDLQLESNFVTWSAYKLSKAVGAAGFFHPSIASLVTFPDPLEIDNFLKFSKGSKLKRWRTEFLEAFASSVVQMKAKVPPMQDMLRNAAFRYQVWQTKPPDDLGQNDLPAVFRGSLACVAAGWRSEESCLPGTRTAVIEEITAWAGEASDVPNVFWVYGTGGCGKSRIANSVAEQLNGKTLASTFFFKRNDVRRKALQIFSTLAVDLAERHEGLRPQILSALEQHRPVLQMSLKEQFSRLILAPVKSFASGLSPATLLPRLVIWDAVDECEDLETRTALFDTLKEGLAAVSPVLRFLITSRPLKDMQLFMSHIQAIHYPLHPFPVPTSDSTERDLRAFFERGLQQVGTSKNLPTDWVTGDEITALVRHCAGLFIWATRALNLIARARDPKVAVQRLLPLTRITATLQAPSETSASLPFLPAPEQPSTAPHAFALWERHSTGYVFTLPGTISIDSSDLDLTQHVEKTGEYPVASGGFADVWRGIHFRNPMKREEPVCVAVKELRVQRTPSDILQRRLVREMEVWARLQHPNILPFMGFTHQEAAPIGLISPWMPDGNVMEYLELHPDLDRCALIQGIARGLAYLHTRFPIVIHGDIKAANVLASSTGQPLLADFGLATFTTGDPMGVTSLEHGSRRWMAPERIHPSAYGLTSAQSRTTSSDIFSFGMTTFEILSGDVPYVDRNGFAAQLAIVTGERPVLQPHWYADPKAATTLEVMSHCWSSQASERPAARAVLDRLDPEAAATGGVLTEGEHMRRVLADRFDAGRGAI